MRFTTPRAAWRVTGARANLQRYLPYLRPCSIRIRYVLVRAILIPTTVRSRFAGRLLLPPTPPHPLRTPLPRRTLLLYTAGSITAASPRRLAFGYSLSLTLEPHFVVPTCGHVAFSAVAAALPAPALRCRRYTPHVHRLLLLAFLGLPAVPPDGQGHATTTRLTVRSRCTVAFTVTLRSVRATPQLHLRA